MTVNWNVRVKNKAWWLAIIPAIAILIQAILSAFNISWDYTSLVGKLAAIIEAAFAVAALVGINVDPTTDDWSDSARAMAYEKPAPNVKEQPIVYVPSHLYTDDGKRTETVADESEETEEGDPA